MTSKELNKAALCQLQHHTMMNYDRNRHKPYRDEKDDFTVSITLDWNVEACLNCDLIRPWTEVQAVETWHKQGSFLDEYPFV